jgi:hypothetical protein
MQELAFTWMKQKRWTEAEGLFAKVLEARTRVLGSEHADTLHSMAFLAKVYSETQPWLRAEELMTRALQGYEDLYGAQNPKTWIELRIL